MPTAKELDYLNSSEFELKGVKYKAIDVEKSEGHKSICYGCAFDDKNIRKCMAAPQCSGIRRTDGREVIFVKVEDNVI